MRNRLSTVLLISILFLLFSPLIDQAYASTVEIRYMRDTYALSTSQGTTVGDKWINTYSGDVSVTQYFQIKVYKVNASETLMSTSNVGSGSASAFISFTVAITNTSMISTDQIRIKVYIDDFNPPTSVRGTFTTEALGASQMDAATWTFYCYLKRTRTGIPGEYETTYDFQFGSSIRNSRITNFTWTLGEGKSWHSIPWDFTLLTRKWTSIPWTFSLSTKTWNSIEWLFGLDTRSWHSVEWMFELLTRKWTFILWIFDLIPHMWHSILWDFSLTAYPVSFPILFVGFAFVFLLAIGIILYYYWEK